MQELTKSFKTFLAKRAVQILSSDASNFYTFMGKGIKTSGWSNTEPTVSGVRYETDAEIVYGKKIKEDDIKLMVKNYPWESGTVYEAYDDSKANIWDYNYYVTSDENDGTKSVFKCIHRPEIYTNSVWSPVKSFIRPSKIYVTPEDIFYTAADGYKWAFLYNISVENLAKFSSNLFIPVIPDGAVSSNAVHGAIHSFKIENHGSGYTKYVEASLITANFNGKANAYALQAALSDLIIYEFNSPVDVTDVSPGQGFVLHDGDVEVTRGIIYDLVDEGPVTKLYLLIPKDVELLNYEDLTLSLGISNSVFNNLFNNLYEQNVLSYNSNDYNGNTLYVEAGPGAGQTRKILKYTVIESINVFELDSPFSPQIDKTSKLIVCPTIEIVGDGSGAKSIPVIDRNTSSIDSIKIINPGSGYNFAYAQISGNTSFVNLETGELTTGAPAAIRPIISPLGGHGYDSELELYSSAVCISTTFDETAPITNGYNKIGIIGGAVVSGSNTDTFDDRTVLDITYAYSGSNSSGFIVGEDISQSNVFATGLVHEIDGDLVKVTFVKGTFVADPTKLIVGGSSGATAIINTVTEGPRLKRFCETFYVEDLGTQINRSEEQDEVAKIVITF